MRDTSISNSNRYTSALTDRIAAILANHTEMDAAVACATEDPDPDALARAGVVLLARKPEFEGREIFAATLAADQRYLRHLIDTSLLSSDESLVAAEALFRADTAFLVSLIRVADLSEDSPSVMRALELIDRLGKTSIAAQWVRRLTVHPDPMIRSKSVKMLSCLHINLVFIEKQLGSSDARVRANAVEALWGLNSHSAKLLLERASRDDHHRVSANGLLGLLMADSPGAAERIIRASATDSPQLSAAVAWAMGQTILEEFGPELDRLAQDSDEGVRRSAESAIKTRSASTGAKKEVNHTREFLK